MLLIIQYLPFFYHTIHQGKSKSIVFMITQVRPLKTVVTFL
jgi:hypothetical protein